MNTEEKLDNILNDVCEQFKISKEQVRSARRFPILVLARYEFTIRATEITDDKELIVSYINRDRTSYYHYIDDYQPITLSQ